MFHHFHGLAAAKGDLNSVINNQMMGSRYWIKACKTVIGTAITDLNSAMRTHDLYLLLSLNHLLPPQGRENGVTPMHTQRNIIEEIVT